jgi:SAM-dependent methyltransferase
MAIMANEAQARNWNEVNAGRWQRLRGPTTRPLLPFGDAALEALAPRQGESALDVGCGFGETTLALATRTGSALGIDICGPFLETARREATAGARYLLADAQTHRFDERFDLLFSRFGLMFFDDPPAAFSNLRRALREGARFAAVVWGAWQENEWVTVPLEALRAEMAVPDPQPGPGPFALSDPGRLAALLENCGFGQVSIARLELPFDADARQLTEQGPAAAALRNNEHASEDLRERFAARLAAMLQGRLPRAVALLVTGLARSG